MDSFDRRRGKVIENLGDKEVLRAHLQSVVDRAFQDKPRITDMRLELHPYSSTFDSYVVSLDISDNRQQVLFLKDYSRSNRPVQQLDQRRARERLVYSEILSRAGLGTATYLGSVWDDQHKRYWLFLEYVDGKLLKLSGLDAWFDAIAWLVGLHDYSARNHQMLSECGFLMSHDESLFLGTADAAVGSVSRYSSGLARQLDSALRGYESLTRAMTEDERVLVHGSYNRLHILSDQASSATRVCPVDWESAATGSNLFDLAFLLDGFGEPQLGQFMDFYWDRARNHGIAVPPATDVRRRMNGYLMHRTLKWLSWAWDEEFPEAKVANLIDRVQRLSDEAS